MKTKWFLLVPVLFYFFSGPVHAESKWPYFDYSVQINDQGYDLQIEMIFAKDVSLNQIKDNFSSGFVLSKVNPQVLSVSRTLADENDYEQLMKTKIMMMKSELKSSCHETEIPSHSWNRRCNLDTTYKSGQYMVWKSDEISCEQNDQQLVQCLVLVKGLGKPLRLAGLELMSAKAFMVRAKYRALLNFAMTWFYSENGSVSIDLSNSFFADGPLKKSIEKFQEIGLQEVKNKEEFRYHDRQVTEPMETKR